MQQASTKGVQKCVGKVIQSELCKRLKFYHTTKWYTHKPVSLLENETHKILCDFKLQTDHLISTRRPNLELIKKRICHQVDFAITAD